MKAACTIAIAWLVLLTPLVGARATTITVTYGDGRPYEVLRAWQIDESFFVSIDDVARMLCIDVEKDAPLTKAVLIAPGMQIEIPLASNVWLRNGESLLVGKAALLEEGNIVVSIDALVDLIADAFGTKMTWDRNERRLAVGVGEPNLLDLEVTPNGDRVSIRFKTAGLPRYDFFPMADDRFEIFIPGGIVSRRMGFSSETHLVRSVEVRQEPQGVRISVRLQDPGLEYIVFPARDQAGIFAIVKRLGLGGIPEPELRPPRALGHEERLSLQKSKIEAVVIDPGHGGDNTGAVGPSGLMEKLVNLEIALKAKEILESKGLQVILTRSRDVDLGLKARTEIANSVGSGLFISIHANGHRKPTASGFEVYFHSLPSDDDARGVSSFENQVIGSTIEKSDETDDIAFILWDTAQTEFIAQSSHLAQLVNEELAKRLSIRNRGVKQADFVVLRGIHSPAILIETAFITNPEEEKMLRDKDFQRSIAEAIAQAVIRFKNHYGR